MSEVRIVPVTRRHFEEACARPGAVIERLKVKVPDGPDLPLDYIGVTRADGAFAVVDHFIADHQSGRYVLNFERYREPRDFRGMFYFHGHFTHPPMLRIHPGDA